MLNVTTTDVFWPFVGDRLTLDGQVITGSATSTTVIGKVQVLLFPALSRAVQVTYVVVKTVNLLTLESGQLSNWMPLGSVAVTLDWKLMVGSGRLSDI